MSWRTRRRATGGRGNGIKAKRAGNGHDLHDVPETTYSLLSGAGAAHCTALGIWVTGELIMRYAG